MLKSNARKKRNITALSKGQSGGNIFKKIKKMGDRLSKKYSGIAKMAGADKVAKAKLKESLPTIENKLSKAGVSDKVIKPLSKEINKKLGGALVRLGEQNQVGEGDINDALTKLHNLITEKDPYNVKQVGTGWFDDLISVVSILPIPIVSCMARTVAVVKTAVQTATSDDPVKAFGGVVGDIAEKVDSIAPAPLKEITAPAKEYVQAIGFGAISPTDTTKMLKVGMNHLNDIFDNIVLDTLPTNKKKQILSAKKSVKQALPEINKLKVGGGAMDFLNRAIDMEKKNRLKVGGRSWAEKMAGVDIDAIRRNERNKLKVGGRRFGDFGPSPPPAYLFENSFPKMKGRGVRELKMKADAERKAIFDRMHF